MTSEARSARPGAGARLPRGSPARRRTPSRRRISVSAERLVASMAASACRACSVVEAEMLRAVGPTNLP